MYFDANSLYSSTMCNPLPVGKFKWVKTSLKKFILKSFKGKTYKFLVECNIKYLKKLHNHHNDYPLAPEKLVVDDEF